MNTKTVFGSVVGWAIWGTSLTALLVVLFVSPASLELGEPALSSGRVEELAKAALQSLSAAEIAINNLWLAVAMILVVLMQPGFAFLESGFLRSGTAINVLFKNTIDFCLNGVCFFLIGYSLMWNSSAGSMQFHGEVVIGWLPSGYAPNGIVPSLHFLFQLVFATTAATICSGLVAGRIRAPAYFVATVIISSVIYPISGFWAWCANEHGPVGFLNRMGYHDLAGSSVVHVVGGFAGLAGAIVLGPRLGRYDGDERLIELRETKMGEIPGLRRYDKGIHKPHSFTSITLGTFMLWVGWFGFNGGSELAMSGDHASQVGFIMINTMLSACGGGITGALAPYFSSWLQPDNGEDDKPQTKAGPFYSMDGMLNGILGGLVAITAGCNLTQEPMWAVLIGMMAGLLVHLVTFTLNNLPTGWRVDDPVGAFSVHGGCGSFGIICCAFLPGLDGKIWERLGTQAFGLGLIAAWSFGVSFFVFWTMGKLKILRSTYEDEIAGLDVGYHGQSAYTLESQGTKEARE